MFSGFGEGEIKFPPTFKFDAGTDRYDTSSKKRVPSWTDRILFKTLPGVKKESLLQREYGCIPAMKASDHRPVYARFQLDMLGAGGLAAPHAAVGLDRRTYSVELIAGLEAESSMEQSRQRRLQLKPKQQQHNQHQHQKL